jgi:hypothetical protein
MSSVSHGQKSGVFALALAGAPNSAYAVCSGGSSPIALQSFEKDPAAWLAANGNASDLGAQIAALAAAATNEKDKGFGSALNSLLGNASGDQGTATGRALGTLNNSCTDPRGPADAGDKQYIAANIAPNVRSNANANLAYGEASGPQTAATGGGGGAGVGGQTGTGFAGGTNTGAPFPSAGTPTAFRPVRQRHLRMFPCGRAAVRGFYN